MPCGRLVAALLVALAAGCEPPAQDLVVYVSADEYVARAVIGAFERESGLAVGVVGDTELQKTTGLVERLRAERDHPVADVLWSSEIFQTIGLADEGVLAPFRSPTTDARPRATRDETGRWFALAARARVIVYATDRVRPDEIPVTWTDLTNERWRDRIVMADPRFGTTGGHLGAMKAWWDRHAMPGYYRAFLLGLRDNGIRLLPGGNAAVVEAVARGEADVGLTDTDDVWAAQARGLPVAAVPAAHSHEDEPGNGTLLIPNTVSLVTGARHPEAAGRFLDFMLGGAGERLLADSVSGNIPLDTGLAAEYPDRAVADPLDLPWSRAAAARDDAIRLAMEILAGGP